MLINGTLKAVKPSNHSGSGGRRANSEARRSNREEDACWIEPLERRSLLRASEPVANPTYIHMHTSTHTYICMHACTEAILRLCVHVYAYRHMSHVCIYICYTYIHNLVRMSYAHVDLDSCRGQLEHASSDVMKMPFFTPTSPTSATNLGTLPIT